VGYVRVVAMLDDGTVAEDVAFMNGPRAGERIDVNLVELFVVVTNDQGRPVRGLTQDDFRVREQGRDQEIAGFSDAGDLPLTLGMAIDSSASMFVKLPTVQRAAIRFLRSTFTEQDRAFVVDFDDQPRLVRATTHQLESVERSIESLEPSGRTALWESIVYSLVQLQGVRGRKALIVFSDGADEDDNFPFTSCLSFAKKMGVPIYLILMKRKPRESAGLSLFIRSFETKVDRLVASTGGRVFYAKEYENLDEVYDEIETELRSQYLLTYYPKSNGGNASWRHVDVQVVRQGLRPRTLSGYWP
jgi:Ca-activated chloride channel family protein